MRRTRRFAAVLALGIALAGCANSTPVSSPGAGASAQTTVAAPAGQSCQVNKVTDGDTVWVDCGQGTSDKIRIIGMDTPETVHPKKKVECYGPEASAEAKRLLTGQKVTLVTDPTQGDVDKYGRKLGYIYLSDGRLFEEVMISGGFAREYTYGKKYQLRDRLTAAEATAKAQKKGLWGAC